MNQNWEFIPKVRFSMLKSCCTDELINPVELTRLVIVSLPVSPLTVVKVPEPKSIVNESSPVVPVFVLSWTRAVSVIGELL
jgi:hypothetical protein